MHGNRQVNNALRVGEWAYQSLADSDQPNVRYLAYYTQILAQDCERARAELLAAMAGLGKELKQAGDDLVADNGVINSLGVAQASGANIDRLVGVFVATGNALVQWIPVLINQLGDGLKAEAESLWN